jgi:hypothetical protein
MRTFGHNIVKFRIGLTSLSPPESPSLQVKISAPKQFSLQFSIFRLILIFAATLTDITVASYNLHGYKKSANYHKSRLQAFGGIWMVQELWLTEQQIFYFAAARNPLQLSPNLTYPVLMKESL